MKGNKLILVLDAIIIAIITMAFMTGTVITNQNLNASNNLWAKTELNQTDKSFNLIASPEEKRVKAGETVEITLSVKDINVGETGLNSVVGFLGYNEALFDSMEIEGVNNKAKGKANWAIELNKRKDHKLYGKFCIYTMEEGVKDEQDVVKMTLKLKKDLKPQTTKVTFTELASSDGEIEVPEEDRAVTIIIYEDEPVKEEEPKKETPAPVQTGDKKIAVVIAVAVLTVILNILVFTKNKKTKVLSTILVMVLGLSCLGIVSYAAENNINVLEVINRLNVKQSWLNSEDYLVTEENVSRIAPGTKVETIANKFNKEIVVESKDGKTLGNKEVIGTGAKISIKNASDRNGKDAEGDYKYTVSVWGDTNGDGKSNQVELTSIIRNEVNATKWGLKGEKFLSGDITVDNKINKEDVIASVKYIVYEEMEIPTFDPVAEPTIEIIEGTYEEDGNYYSTNVKVKITEQAKNGAKTQYKVENSKGEQIPYTEISREEKNTDGKYETVIELQTKEIYKVSAYTTGVLGNRSEIPYIIVNGIYNDIYEYNVEYYYNGVKSTEITDKKYEKIGTMVTEYTPTEESKKAGYVLDETMGTNGIVGLPLTITKNTSTNVIKVYYVKQKYTLKLIAGENIATVSNGTQTSTADVKEITKQYEYDEEINITAVLKEAQTGHTVKFEKWEPTTTLELTDEFLSGITGETKAQTTIHMPEGNLTLTAKATDTVNKYKYHVEYYYDEVKDESEEMKDERGPVDYGTVITRDGFTPKTGAQKLGYILDETKGEGGIEGLSAPGLTIGTDETQNVIKVYYKEKEGVLTIHHYLNGTENDEEPVKVAEDEIYTIEYGLSYEVTNLLSNENKIKINNVEQTQTRNYLSSEAYSYVKVQAEEGTTIADNGVVTGTAHKGMGDITYCYDAETRTITGIVKIQVADEAITESSTDGGTITGLPESVVYGTNSQKTIKVRPTDGYRVKKVKAYKGSEITGTYDMSENTGKELLSMISGRNVIVKDQNNALKNVTEDILVVVVVKKSEYVAKIVAVPGDNQRLADMPSNVDNQKILGHEYTTLEAAIDDAQKVNNAKGDIDGYVEIQIIDDVIGETNKIERDNDVIIDLNGFTVSADDEQKATIQVIGDLVVIDRSIAQTGTIKNATGYAIKANENSTLTLGINDEGEAPSRTTPRIEGGTSGINKDPDATFNFYDGRIVANGAGDAPVTDEQIDDKPEFYEAIAGSPQETPTEEYLMQPAGIVAIIKGVGRYPTIESAFAAADDLNTSEEVEIDLIDSVVLDNNIEIGEDKNYVLDLNGNIVRAANTTKKFQNKGTFKVIDSSANYEGGYKFAQLEHSEEDEGYFERWGDVLLPNNNGGEINHSFIEIDLKKISDSVTNTVSVTQYAAIKEASSAAERVRYVPAAIAITESPEMPAENDPSWKNFTNTSMQEKQIEVPGGKKYYLHIKSDRYGTGFNPYFAITSIKLNNKSLIEELKDGKGDIIAKIESGDKSKDEQTAKLIIEKAHLTGNIDFGGEIEVLHSRVEAYISPLKNSNVAKPGNAYVDGGSVLTIESGTDLTINNAYVYSGIAEGKIETNSNFVSLKCGEIAIDDLLGVSLNVTHGTIDNSKFIKLGIKDGNVTNSNISDRIECTAIVENYVKDENALVNIDNVTTDYFSNETNTIIKNSTTGEIGNAYTIVKEKILTQSYKKYIYQSKLTIENSTVNGGISNQGAELNINDSTINGDVINRTARTYRDEYCEGPYRQENWIYARGILNLNSGTINGSISCIYDEIAKEKTVSSYQTAGGEDEQDYIDNVAIVNIGKKNTSATENVSTEAPVIKQVTENKYAVQQKENGIINYYDGKIISHTGYGISGALNELEQNTRLIISNATEQIEENAVNEEIITLSKTGNPVARIATSSGITVPDGTQTQGNYYVFSRLEDAINSCPTNAQNVTEIELIDLCYVVNQINIDGGRKVAINLNGNDLRISSGIIKSFRTKDGICIRENSSLKLKNTSAEGKLDGISANALLYNEGTLDIEENLTIAPREVYRVIENVGTLNFNGGIIERDNTRLIHNVGIVNINSGRIIGHGNMSERSESGDKTYYNSNEAIYSRENGSITINGGTINTEAVTNTGSSTLTITGGTIETLIKNSSEETVNITGGTISELTSSTTAQINISGTAENLVHINKMSTNGYVNMDYCICKYTINDSVGGEVTVSGNYASISNSTIKSCTINNNTENTTTINNSSIDILSISGQGIINNSNIEEKTIGRLSNTGAGLLTVKNATVTDNIQNGSSGTITLENVTGKRIVNSSSGDIRINKGTELNVDDSKSTPVVTNTGSGSIYFGNDEDDLSLTDPEIIAKGKEKTAIKNTGTGKIHFLNGRMTGKTGEVYSGQIEARGGYSIINADPVVEGLETKILGKASVAKILQAQANIGLLGTDEVYLEEGYYHFYELQDAINSCNSNGTINITAEIPISSNSPSLAINSDDKIIIDLNGHTVTCGNSNTIVNNGDLTIIDSSTNKTGKFVLKGTTLIDNKNKLVIDGAKVVTSAVSGTAESRNVLIKNSGTLEVINKAQISSSSDYYVTLIENTGILKIFDETYTGADGESRTTVTGGTKTQNMDREYSIDNKENGTVEITNSSIEHSYIVNSGNGTIKIEESNVGVTGIINEGTSTTATNGKPAVSLIGNSMTIGNTWGNPDSGYSSEVYNLYNNAGEMIIKDKSSEKITTLYGDSGTIFNEEGASLVIENVKIEDCANGDYWSGEVYVKNKGEMKILDCDIEICSITNDGTANILGGQLKCSITNNGTLNVGDNSNEINVNSPKITGGKLKNNSVFNFYDGTIINNETIEGEINSIPENSHAIFTVDGNAWTYTLSKTAVVAKIGNTEYHTLESALQNCPNDAQTATQIDLQVNLAITKGREFTISNNKNVKLNLNNNRVYSNSKNTLITNNATLEIANVGDATKGEMYVYSSIIIDNTKDLTISGGKYRSLVYRYDGTVKLINNTGDGNVTITGGDILASEENAQTSEKTYAIYSNSTGNVRIQGGDIGVDGISNTYVVGITGLKENCGSIVEISGDASVHMHGYELNVAKLDEIKNVTLNISGGTIYSTSLKIDSCRVNITGGTIGTGLMGAINSDVKIAGAILNCELQTDVNTDVEADGEETYIYKIAAGKKAKIYGGTYGVLTGKNKSEYAEYEIDGSQGVSNDKVIIEELHIGKGGANVSHATINYVSVSGYKDWNAPYEIFTSNATIGEGVKIESHKTGGALLVGEYSNVIIANGDTEITNDTGYGIAIAANGELTLGSKEDSTINNTPVIKGKKGGIKVSDSKAKFNWYDGVAICTDTESDSAIAYECAISGYQVTIDPHFVDHNYGVVFENNNKKAYIGPITDENIEAKYKGTTYPTLEAAIEAATDSSEIMLMAGVYRENTEPIVIPSGKNIVINLNGYGITGKNAEKLIHVEEGATLTIKDTSADGSIVRNTTGPAIQNDGTLNLQISADKIQTGVSGDAITGSGTVNNN